MKCGKGKMFKREDKKRKKKNRYEMEECGMNKRTKIKYCMMRLKPRE